MSSVIGSFVKYALRPDIDKPITESWIHEQRRINGDAVLRWPLAKRVQFLYRLGVDPRTVRTAIEKMSPLPRGLEDGLGTVDSLINATAPFPISKGRIVNDFSVKSGRECANKARKPDGGGLPCCKERTGANSLTMLRHPWSRLVSAFFYKGHSPNYDVYELRPSEWIHPSGRNESNWRNRNFDEYVSYPEYQNSITKMFGDSHGCRGAQGCDRQGDKCSNALAVACHGYRNATYLNEEHLRAAKRALRAHAFFGLLEAYNSSVNLMAVTFGIQLNEADFVKDRVRRQTSKDLAVKTNAKFCRLAMQNNRLDALLYEWAHREFCERLTVHGLMEDVNVRRELARKGFCGETDFSEETSICGPIEDATRALTAVGQRNVQEERR